jgi:hypothetical protein
MMTGGRSGGVEGGGTMTANLIGLLIFVIDIYAIYLVITGGGSVATKVLWVVLILLLPVIGVILYFLLGRTPALR